MEYRSDFIREPDIKAVYKIVDGFELPLWIYLPQGDFSNAETVVCIHGGSWETGIQDDFVFDGLHMRYQADYYSKMGKIGVAISYRSVKTGATIKDLAGDCVDALKYLADNFNFVDKEKVYLVGDSAGAQLCATLIRKDTLPFKIKGAALCNPVSDLTIDKWKHAAPDSLEERTELSPLNFAKEIDSDCKILLMHGTKDNVVPIEDTEKLYNILKENGYNVKFIKVKDAYHAFILFNYEAAESDICNYMDAINQYLGL